MTLGYLFKRSQKDVVPSRIPKLPSVLLMIPTSSSMIKMQGNDSFWVCRTNLIHFQACTSLSSRMKRRICSVTIKISENTEKITNPGNKTIYRMRKSKRKDQKPSHPALPMKLIDPRGSRFSSICMDTWKKTKLARWQLTLYVKFLTNFKNGECLY